MTAESLLPGGSELDAEPGGLPRAARRLSYPELVDQGLVAPGDDPYRYFDQDNKRRRKSGRPEERAADWLREHGITVRSVDYARVGEASTRRPDAVIDALRRTIEIKTLRGRTSRTVEEAIRRGVDQSDISLVDAREAALAVADVAAGMRAAVSRNGVSITEVIVVVSDHNHLTWRHG